MDHYYLFVITTLLISLTPGADTVLVTKNTLVQGKEVGFKTAGGICAGITVHIAIAVLGLSAIIAKSVLLFAIIKYAGAAFLILMGIFTLFSKKRNFTSDATTSEKTPKGSFFLQGMFSNVLNPKAIIFFVSFLPQFIVPGEHNLLKMMIIGITPVLITFIWLFFYVNLINYIREWFNKPSFLAAFQRLTGLMLITLGMKLAFAKR
ncbi:LysE family translocator [Priestia megaterium]|uniref:LysE family translocator n=1 Tax=Priestia megaterium TaxID=1404 RepID=UPI001BE9E4BF|nr:LysE family translocator [Priestia megaterium]MBT2259721.1 LysE family translocator [Priestia megaterium]MBT2280937.1 LysE family translocator [Priestia megaterium]